jgi:ferric iron reductase protein FhuF
VAATEVGEALRRIAEVGAYFALDSGHGADWRPYRALLTDPALLAERVRLVRTTIATRGGVGPDDVEERACASVHFLGVVSRVLAPALGVAALAAVVPDVDPDDIWWRPVAGGPIPMSWEAVRGSGVTSAVEAAALIEAGVLRRVVAPLVQSFATTFRLSAQVLWGNAASALAGAATMLATSSAVLALDPVDIVAASVRTGALTGAGAYRPAPPGPPAFRRDNCCLFYRIPGGGLCGDCVLAPPGATTS